MENSGQIFSLWVGKNSQDLAHHFYALQVSFYLLRLNNSLTSPKILSSIAAYGNFTTVQDNAKDHTSWPSILKFLISTTFATPITQNCWLKCKRARWKWNTFIFQCNTRNNKIRKFMKKKTSICMKDGRRQNQIMLLSIQTLSKIVILGNTGKKSSSPVVMSMKIKSENIYKTLISWSMSPLLLIFKEVDFHNKSFSTLRINVPKKTFIIFNFKEIKKMAFMKWVNCKVLLKSGKSLTFS